MIEVEGLTKLYGGFAAVTNLSFSVRAGELLGLVGPNGAGKTSTLRCLAGIIPPTRGTVRISGHLLTEDPVAAKRELAFFSDEPRLFEYLTVEQHLQFTARIYQVRNAAQLIPPLLADLELTDKAHRLPGELSRGMKQKVQIACGLLHSPRAVFFDEPLTGLDPLAIRRMKDTIRRLAREGASIIISSHLLHLLEELCTHVLILRGGLNVAHGTLEQVLSHFGSQGLDSTLEDVFVRIAMEGNLTTGKTGVEESRTAPPPIPPAFGQ